MVCVLLHRLAAREARKAEAWYGNRSPTAAARFRAAVEAACRLIAQNPDIHPILAPGFQFIRLKRFPYLLVFQRKSASTVLVLAVAHSRRRKEYWRKRV